MFSLMRCVPWGCHWKASETAVRALADLLKSTIQVCLLYSVSVVLIHLVLHECVEARSARTQEAGASASCATQGEHPRAE